MPFYKILKVSILLGAASVMIACSSDKSETESSSNTNALHSTSINNSKAHLSTLSVTIDPETGQYIEGHATGSNSTTTSSNVSTTEVNSKNRNSNTNPSGIKESTVPGVGVHFENTQIGKQ